MSAWAIDNFGMRENHFLNNKWFDTTITVDEFGNIQSIPVPGKVYPLKNCLADYDKNNRSFVADQLITEFCNLDTYTNYRVYAQDCKPFAYVQEDLNAAKCGYLQPLSQPFKPNNPWGTAVYNLFAYIDFCDEKNVPINVKIYKRSFTGIATQINNAAANPIVLSYKNTNDNKFNPIRSCELQLTLVSDANFDLEQLYTQDEREFKVEILKNSITKFIGFGTAEDATEEFVATPYDITWRATDGFGMLKTIDYPVPLGSSTNVKQNFVEILCYCLAMTNLNLDIATICNLYEVKMNTGIDDDPLIQASVNPLRLTDSDNKILSCYAVLEKICYQFGAFIVQDNGIWNFTRQSELGNAILRRRIYNYTGLFIKSEQINNKRIATCNGIDISILNDNPTIRISNAYKKAEAILNYGKPNALLYNGDFEVWNGSNWPGWTKYGGINVSRIEKQIVTTSGNLPSGNFAIQFNERADNGKYIEANKITVLLNDALTLTFNIGQAVTDPLRTLSVFKVRIKLGNYYLYNPTNDDNYIWVNQLTTCNVNVENTATALDVYLKTMKMPAAPVSGDLYIQFFGFYLVDKPIYMDNVKIETIKENKASRVLYVSQQDDFYTTVPDQIEILFGDVVPTIPTVLTVPNSTPAPAIPDNSNQYGIFTKDGSFSTGWYEYNNSTLIIPIGLALTRSIMKAYQVPFRFLQSSFIGNNISYLDIFNIYLPNNPGFSSRIFALLSGDFNLTSGEVNNANYVEIFSKPGKTNDFTIGGAEGDPSPPIPMNPLSAIRPTGRIFTNEFTNPFK